MVTVLILFVVTAVFGFGVWNGVYDSRFNADEGFYLAAARATLSGDLPYRDYGYTQGPVLPLVDAPLLTALPPTLETFRWICSGWAACGLLVAFFLMDGRHRPLGAALGLLPLASAPIVLPYLCVGKTYSLAQLFVLLAAGGLLLPWSARRCLVWSTVFGVMAVGTRLTLAPVVGLLWLGLWWQRRNDLNWQWAVGVPALVAAAVIGPFAALDPERFVFWNLQYHQASSFPRYPAGAWSVAWAGAPGVWCGAILALGLVWRARRTDPAGAVMLVAAAGGIAVNLLTAGIFYPEYLAPFVVLLLVAAVRVLLAGGLSHGRLLLVFAACLALNLACARSLKPEDSFQQDFPLFAQARAAAEFLRANTRPGDPVLACNAEIPVAAGRPLYANLVMGKFAVTADCDESRADRLGLLHFRRLNQAIEGGRIPAVVLTNSPNWNFYWSAPSLRPVPELNAEFFGNLRKYYVVGYESEIFVVLLPRR